jgi:hypothetical protein
MPFTHHARYREGNKFQRFSQSAVETFTADNHSRFYVGPAVPASAEELGVRPKVAPVARRVVTEAETERLVAKLLGLSSATLARLLKRFGVAGRSKLRTKQARVKGLLGPVERLNPTEAEALFV